MTKILILGNGFDLAHDLPTSYSMFLNFCERFIDLINDDCNWTETEFDDGINFILNNFEQERESKIIDKLYKLQENFWYNYMLYCYKKELLTGNNWLDFEFEIERLVSWIDNILIEEIDTINEILDKMEINETVLNKERITYLIKELRKISKICTPNLEAGTPYTFLSEIETKKNLIKYLKEHLLEFTEAFELYLSEFVSAIEVDKLELIKNISPEHIINFNYTKTYEKFYLTSDIDILHIHGEIRDDVFKGKSELILGIRGEDKYNKEFLLYQKNLQKIKYNTGSKHKKLLDMINENYNNKKSFSEIYIYGHSLDLIDKDILFEFLVSEATSVMIYCLEEDYEDKLANITKMIGIKKFEEKYHEDKIKFKILDSN